MIKKIIKINLKQVVTEKNSLKINENNDNSDIMNSENNDNYEKIESKIDYKNGAGDGNRTREGTNPLGPQPSAFDRSTTPA